jgi:hypothetical protein
MPIAYGIRLAEVKDGVVDHFIDRPQDRVIKIAVYVGIDLK